MSIVRIGQPRAASSLREAGALAPMTSSTNDLHFKVSQSRPSNFVSQRPKCRDEKVFCALTKKGYQNKNGGCFPVQVLIKGCINERVTKACR